MSFGEKMNDRDLSVFVHEYVHFLQDITTLYGLEGISSDFGTLTNMVSWVKSNKHSPIYVPLPETILDEITKNNRFISDSTWGESGELNNIEIIDINIDSSISIAVDDYRTVESVIIKYKTNESEEGICSFGAREIYEGMAYLIEQHITKDFESSPDLPYNTALKVLERLYPILASDYKNILILCDLALMSSNPGVEYVRMIGWIKENNFVPNNSAELFAFMEEKWETHDINAEAKRIDFLIEKVEEVRANMHSVLKNDAFFADFHNWVDTIFDNAIELRRRWPLFWLYIVEDGYVKDNPSFQTIYRLIGAPLVETAKHEYFFIPPEGCEDSTCLVYFKVFNQIYTLLVEGNLRCNLMPWCNNPNNLVEVDSSCHKCPWNHSPKDGYLCTFCGIWQHCGLNGIDIRKG